MNIARLASVVVLALAGVFVTRAVRVTVAEQHLRAQRYEDVYYLPTATVLPIVSLGYHAALADLLWCRSLVYFGEELAHRGQVRYVFDYADAILALDPDFREPYRWVSLAAIYRPRAVDVRDALRAADYLRRAVERWPADGELHWDYGSLLRFEIAPLLKDQAQKNALLERAAPHIAEAARHGAGPAWLGLNSIDLLNKLGRSEQALRHLEELYATVRDPAVRAELAARLQQVRSRVHVAAMQATIEAFSRAHDEAFPYLSEDLFLLVGERTSFAAYAGAVARRYLPDDERAAELVDPPTEEP